MKSLSLILFSSLLLCLVGFSTKRAVQEDTPSLHMTFSNGKKVTLSSTETIFATANNYYEPVLKMDSYTYPYNFVLRFKPECVTLTGDTYRGKNVVVTPKIGTCKGSLIYYGNSVSNDMSFDPPAGWSADIEITKYEAPYVWFNFSSTNRHGTFKGVGQKIKFVGK